MVTKTEQPANPKPKRRWYQYSLRTLLICVTLFAVACSWFAIMGRSLVNGTDKKGISRSVALANLA
jgi:hypothetical protein